MECGILIFYKRITEAGKGWYKDSREDVQTLTEIEKEFWKQQVPG